MHMRLTSFLFKVEHLERRLFRRLRRRHLPRRKALQDVRKLLHQLRPLHRPRPRRDPGGNTHQGISPAESSGRPGANDINLFSFFTTDDEAK
jgi:hypothetical protein